jgi:hypothetical protein
MADDRDTEAMERIRNRLFAILKHLELMGLPDDFPSTMRDLVEKAIDDTYV